MDQRRAGAARERGFMKTIREKLVLVAENESGLRKMLGSFLKGRHCRVSGACDGAGALRLARAERPELILLDLELPGKDGREVLRELRGGIQTRLIPVVVLTGSAEISEKTAAFELGADDYVTKPFDMDELAARVEGHLARNRRELSADPLTRLPGSPMIETEVKRRIARGIPFAFLRIDIDDFRGFNETRGYELGDELLLAAAGTILGALAEGGLPDDFAGHCGCDDFVAITSPWRAEAVARAVAEGFDRAAARLFPSGAAPTLSVGVASSLKRDLAHYAKAVEIAAEITGFLKSLPRGGRSAWLLDRRRDLTPPGKTQNEKKDSDL